MHLRGRFRSRSVHEFKSQPVYLPRHSAPRNHIGWQNETAGASRKRQIQSITHHAQRPARQQRPIHITGSPAHRIPRHQAFTHGFRCKAFRSEYPNPARQHIRFVHNTFDTAPVIRVAVGINHGHNRLLRTICEIQSQRDTGRFHREQRIHHNDARLTLNKGDHTDAESPHLIDAVGNLKQTCPGHQPRLPPKTGIHAVRSIKTRFEKGERSGDPAIRQRSNQSAPRLRKITNVIEAQLPFSTLMNKSRRSRSRCLSETQSTGHRQTNQDSQHAQIIPRLSGLRFTAWG